MNCTSMILLMLLSADDDPRAAIAGPVQAAAGDLIVLDATGSKATDFAWALAGSPKAFLPIDGGKKCVFASGEPGRYVFILAVANKDRVAIAMHAVEITSRPPTPPEPRPPTPSPSLPDGKFGLGKFAFEAAHRLVMVEPKLRAEQARKLAQSLLSVASAISAGGLSDLEAILEQTRQANNRALGLSIDAWKDWARELAAKLEALDADGRLTTPTEFAVAWRELADSLQVVSAWQIPETRK